MLFAFKRLRNISLASLSAECQDSVCKQSVHVRVVTWRKLLSRCPRSLTPEVNPDINMYSQGQWRSLRRCATPESYRPVITPHGIKQPTQLVGGKNESTSHIWSANTDKVFISQIVKWSFRGVTLFDKLHKSSLIPGFHQRSPGCSTASLELPVKKQPPTRDKREINSARNQYTVPRHFLSGKQTSHAQPSSQQV